MFGGLENPIHLLIILVVALVVLGPKRLPDAGRSLGSAIKGFRESMSSDDSKSVTAGDTHEVPVAPVSAATSHPAEHAAKAEEHVAPEPAAH